VSQSLETQPFSACYAVHNELTLVDDCVVKGHINYKKWLQEKLIFDLIPCSVIVVDNTSYHNTQINRPPTNNRKAEILSWLDKHGIRHSSGMTKVQLYKLIKLHKPQYEILC
jgi:hypothetical protein